MKRSRNDDEYSEECDADDEQSPKRFRYREVQQISDNSSSPARNRATPRWSNSPVGGEILQDGNRGDMLLYSTAEEQSTIRTPSGTQAQSSSQLPAGQEAYQGFDTNVVWDPNDPAGRRPSALNPSYRENGELFTPLYRVPVDRITFNLTSQAAQSPTVARAVDRAASIPHPTLGRRAPRSRATALQQIAGPGRELRRVPTEPALPPAAPLRVSDENAQQTRQPEGYPASWEAFFQQDETAEYEDEQMPISHARS